MAEVLCFEVSGSDIVPVATSAATLNELSLSLPDGVYTTFRTYPGKRVLRLQAHLDRLVESAALEGASLVLDYAAIRQAIAGAVDVAGFDLARVRVTAGLRPAVRFFVSLDRLAALPAGVYARGVRCEIADLALHRQQPRSKATRFIGPGAQAREAASEANEVLLVNAGEQILEGSSSNFFAVLGGTLRTAEEGVLAGITRGIVLGVAKGLLPIDRHPISLGDIPALQEAFITSVSRAVLPVVAIDGVTVGNGSPGPFTGEFMRRFEARLEVELEPIV